MKWQINKIFSGIWIKECMDLGEALSYHISHLYCFYYQITNILVIAVIHHKLSVKSFAVSGFGIHLFAWNIAFKTKCMQQCVQQNCPQSNGEVGKGKLFMLSDIIIFGRQSMDTIWSELFCQFMNDIDSCD